MLTPSEDKSCYASAVQREVLISLLRNGVVTQEYFLTGGTALSVFYLHHRRSNDLDFFTLQETDLGQIDFLLKTTWRHEYVRTKTSTNFLSLLLRDVKVEFVIDRLSNDEERDSYIIEASHHLRIDTPRNIISNKLCALASRTEPKDYIDYYALYNALRIVPLQDLLGEARKKDAIFDDPPTAAYQIESGLRFIEEHQDVLPGLLIPFNQRDFFTFYELMIRQLYDEGTMK